MRVNGQFQNMTDQGPRVGCGAFISDDTGRLLLVRRRRQPEAACWGLPGGKVDAMEKLEDAVIRELREELGIAIRPQGILSVSDQIGRQRGDHWVSIVYLAVIKSGVPEIREPDALSQVGWFAIDALPQPLTTATVEAVKAMTGR